ncbi:cupin domain-containing protein [Rhodopseudomonas palustris]|uniref:Anti-sigma factor ChrR, putative n=1 Tax=Rhodopseudomonas palustris (strain BisB5) TaxID=316057 RepID=Q13EB2_RHOPS|nr:Anti-sigma factor ChrR, putative [Rhodopseudomonas palustris BisB5]MBB1090344.1 cupin domain-containing protein [Rhodopseudomonas palustris]
MTVRHHIGDDLLLSYAAGTLDEASSLLVATHLALCPHCRARAAAADDLGGALFEDLPVAELSPGLRDAVLARLRSESVAAPATRPHRPRSDIVIPEPLRSYLGGDLDTLRWTSVAPRVQQIAIDIANCGPRARMLRFQPGTHVPAHGHAGRELTLVLSGSLCDRDAVLARGDVAETDEHTEHQPYAGPDKDCICLAVTDAPLRFKGMFARMLQPWFGI